MVFDTFFALLTQQDQLRCFENVAARLTDDGVFLVEAFRDRWAGWNREPFTAASGSHIPV